MTILLVPFGTNGTHTWPSKLTGTIQVEAIGGGGGGAQFSGMGSGGNGGDYAKINALAVTKGTIYAVTVGAGGQGATEGQANDTAGGNSSFGAGECLARGGDGGSNGGSGTTAGDVTYTGGTGGIASVDGGGGGGGGAGSGGNGSNGADTVGGAGGSGNRGGATAALTPGQGGTGALAGGTAAVAGRPYGGGGGAGSTASRNGAAGGEGMVIITYGQISGLQAVNFLYGQLVGTPIPLGGILPVNFGGEALLNLQSNAQLSGALSVAPEILRSGDTAQGFGLLDGQLPGQSPTPLSTQAQLDMLGFAAPGVGQMSEAQAIAAIIQWIGSWLLGKL